MTFLSVDSILNTSGKMSTLPFNRANLKELIKQGNLTALEEFVLQGNGDRLLGETSSAPLVQEFLDNLPTYLVCVDSNGRSMVPLNDRFRYSITYTPTLIGSNQWIAQGSIAWKFTWFSISSWSKFTHLVSRPIGRYTIAQGNALWSSWVIGSYSRKLWRDCIRR